MLRTVYIAMYDLNGQVALVTGASSKPGFGRAIAVRLAGEGADVIVTARRKSPEDLSEEDRNEDWKGLESTVEEIRATGRRAISIEADVSDVRQVKAMVEKALDEFGRIDVLVNNAGIAEPRTSITDKDEQVWDRILAVNLTGTFLCSKYVAKSMVERGVGGKIINISSMAGKTATATGSSGYVASKFGVIGLTQGMALDLAQFKINVNAICPGPAPTNLSTGRGLSSQARRDNVSLEEATARRYASHLAQVPLGRLAYPQDVAKAVAFFASSESDYMTGLAVSLTGGAVMF